jgi:hypothetical protein
MGGEMIYTPDVDGVRLLLEFFLKCGQLLMHNKIFCFEVMKYEG